MTLSFTLREAEELIARRKELEKWNVAACWYCLNVAKRGKAYYLREDLASVGTRLYCPEHVSEGKRRSITR